MGLAEKRWAAEKKNTDEAALVAKVNATLGFSVPIEIDWEGFSRNLDDAQYITHDSYGVPNLIKALTSITADALGKEAIKDALKRIVIQAAKSEDTSFTFDQGVITWKAYFAARAPATSTPTRCRRSSSRRCERSPPRALGGSRYRDAHRGAGRHDPGSRSQARRSSCRGPWRRIACRRSSTPRCEPRPHHSGIRPGTWRRSSSST